MNPSDYDYNAAGFDNFMSRSVDNTPQVNLDTPTPPINQVAFDRTQITGMMGDTFTVGKISLNGADGSIILNDGNTDRLLIGNQPGGF